MKLYIWEGGAISHAWAHYGKTYHHNGTLVVLANSVDEARDLVRAKVTEARHLARKRQDAKVLFEEGIGYQYDDAMTYGPFEAQDQWKMFDQIFPEGDPCKACCGTDDAIDSQEPSRVIDVDQPAWVAFNHGGEMGEK